MTLHAYVKTIQSCEDVPLQTTMLDDNSTPAHWEYYSKVIADKRYIEYKHTNVQVLCVCSLFFFYSKEGRRESTPGPAAEDFDTTNIQWRCSLLSSTLIQMQSCANYRPHMLVIYCTSLLHTGYLSNTQRYNIMLEHKMQLVYKNTSTQKTRAEILH